MKKIQIRTGQIVLVDKDDFAELSKYKWNFSPSSRYVRGTVNGKNFSIHRFILKPKRNQCVDHINGDPLDNRKLNLRICSHIQNMANRKLNANNTSGYKGVDKMPNGRFRAKIGKKGKRYNLGIYSNAEQAAAAYNGGALMLFGDYANLNTI